MNKVVEADPNLLLSGMLATEKHGLHHCGRMLPCCTHLGLELVCLGHLLWSCGLPLLVPLRELVLVRHFLLAGELLTRSCTGCEAALDKTR